MIKLSNGDYINPRYVVSVEPFSDALGTGIEIYLTDQHEIKIRFETEKLRDKEIHRLVSLIEGRFNGKR